MPAYRVCLDVLASMSLRDGQVCHCIASRECSLCHVLVILLVCCLALPAGAKWPSVIMKSETCLDQLRRDGRGESTPGTPPPPLPRRAPGGIGARVDYGSGAFLTFCPDISPRPGLYPNKMRGGPSWRHGPAPKDLRDRARQNAPSIPWRIMAVSTWIGGSTSRRSGVGYAVLTAVNGGSKLLIFDRRAAPSADCWCCELHVTSCRLHHRQGEQPL